jgi:hypothetical protein
LPGYTCLGFTALRLGMKQKTPSQGERNMWFCAKAQSLDRIALKKSGPAHTELSFFF